MTDRSPWKVWSGFRRIGSASTRKAAMNVVDRPWMKGIFEVRHVRTGETWKRTGGAWSKTAEGESLRRARPVTPRRGRVETGAVNRPLQRRLL